MKYRDPCHLTFHTEACVQWSVLGPLSWTVLLGHAFGLLFVKDNLEVNVAMNTYVSEHMEWHDSLCF